MHGVCSLTTQNQRRSKLTEVEAKAVYNKTVEINLNEENEAALKIVNIQING